MGCAVCCDTSVGAQPDRSLNTAAAQWISKICLGQNRHLAALASLFLHVSFGRLVRLLGAKSAGRNIIHQIFEDTRKVLLGEPRDQAENSIWEKLREDFATITNQRMA